MRKVYLAMGLASVIMLAACGKQDSDEPMTMEEAADSAMEAGKEAMDKSAAAMKDGAAAVKEGAEEMAEDAADAMDGGDAK